MSWMEATRCSAHEEGRRRRRSGIITQAANDALPDPPEKLKTLSSFPRSWRSKEPLSTIITKLDCNVEIWLQQDITNNVQAFWVLVADKWRDASGILTTESSPLRSLKASCVSRLTYRPTMMTSQTKRYNMTFTFGTENISTNFPYVDYLGSLPKT